MSTTGYLPYNRPAMSSDIHIVGFSGSTWELRHNGEFLGAVRAGAADIREGCDTEPRFWLGLRALRRAFTRSASSPGASTPKG